MFSCVHSSPPATCASFLTLNTVCEPSISATKAAVSSTVHFGSLARQNLSLNFFFVVVFIFFLSLCHSLHNHMAPRCLIWSCRPLARVTSTLRVLSSLRRRLIWSWRPSPRPRQSLGTWSVCLRTPQRDGATTGWHCDTHSA